MEKKKIFVLLGNPDADSFSGTLASTYEKAAEAAGHEIKRLNIGELQFDPVLRRGYRAIQELEPDLVRIQELVNWADHFVVVYPNWWCSMPAILKGMFDRMWLPGFAFNFDKQTKGLIQRLKGKTAHVIIVAGTHSPFMTWLKFGDYTNEITRGILGFAGFKVATTTFGPCDHSPEEKKQTWVQQIEEMGRAGK